MSKASKTKPKHLYNKIQAKPEDKVDSIFRTRIRDEWAIAKYRVLSNSIEYYEHNYDLMTDF